MQLSWSPEKGGDLTDNYSYLSSHYEGTLDRLRERDIELTDIANRRRDAEKVGDYKVRVDQRTHVQEVTRIEGMCSRMARIKRGSAGPAEQAENGEDVGETHEAGQAGPTASGDEGMVQPVS